jgi:tripartite-type tricarboxylate transporter receptor subunit TctC
MVVGFPAGGSADMIARTIAEPLGKRLGTPVVIENVSGAGGTIAGQKVVNAAPDGYTLFMASGSEVSIARLFNPAVNYKGETDFTAIGLVGDVPLVLVASPKSGLKTAAQALAKARREPAALSYASSGIGTMLHVAGELVNQKAGTKIAHVPYRGAAQMAIDVAGGTIELAFFMTPTALPHIETGKMVALGVTTASTSTQRYRNTMKAMNSSPGLGANRRHSRSYGKDLQRRHGFEGALSCFDISGLEY